MEKTSQQNNDHTALDAQIRECYGRVVYSAKTHEKNADLCTRRLSRVKWYQIILSAITTAGLINALFIDPTNYWALVVTTIFSTLQLILNAYTKDIDPGQKSESHKLTAAELWSVRESYLSILTDLCNKNIELNRVREKRDQLQAQLTEIYKNAPRTTEKAYEYARKSLKLNKEMTFSTEELNQLLPEILRKNL